MWLNGGIKDVSSVTEIFVKQRVHDETGKMEDVKIDDACLFHCHFDNGSLGLFESTRYARGHKALFTFEINGEKGSLQWDLHDLKRLEYFNNADDSTVRGWRSIHVTDGDQPYMDKWWVPGLSVGYEHSFVHQVADFLQTLETGEECHPTFRDALETQKVCEAVINSANNRRWEDTHVDWKNI
jgi:predicted dehydrogenase